jgi:hypothetical protein
MLAMVTVAKASQNARLGVMAGIMLLSATLG